ncbi:MAG: YfcC family protein [Chloroflexota bacterium]
MDDHSGVRISRRAFIQAVVIIFVLMLVAGGLTRIVPAGQYQRQELDGRQVIDPTTYQTVDRPDYPAWRWLTAPIEVLGAPGSGTLIGIIVFIVLVGIAFAVMDGSGILRAVIARIVTAFGGRKYPLMLAVTFFFMALGGFFGIFEEVIPLVPVIIALSISLGWDSLVGLGMSVLATNVGFSSAVFNPFTIGIAHRLSGLPLFSGAGMRIGLFFVTYTILALFLYRYARAVERRPELSPVYREDDVERRKYATFRIDDPAAMDPRQRPAIIFLGMCFVLILGVLVASPFVEALSDLALPLTGLLFVIGGVGSGLIAGVGRRAGTAAWDGLLGILPAVPLLLMAASVRHIVASGGILDTLLYWASNAFTGASPFAAAMMIYGLTLVLELFITSGSAKALLLIPILMPLADLVGVNRQIAVSAYAFGDGFSNLAYPTNAALLITLSLTVVPYTKWLRWVVKLWVWVLLVTSIFLAIAVAIDYGPF